MATATRRDARWWISIGAAASLIVLAIYVLGSDRGGERRARIASRLKAGSAAA